ncbi:MAG: hypothetical protein A2X48_00760 [Lentisphaerae bacterium GWF2_49_21]|nr:MAG: hypothetical protein A2X48_00760 [Lentisphaerae bacterium GWF2_49_21]
MNEASLIIALLGWIICLIGYVGILIVAFRKNYWWGIAIVLIPFIPFLVFVILEFRKAWIHLTISIAGFSLMCIGVAMKNY